jgi:hypothetical protein
MIQMPARVPLSRQLPVPELEEIPPAQETHQNHADAPQLDNGISKSPSNDVQISPESSKQISPTNNTEAKKDM